MLIPTEKVIPKQIQKKKNKTAILLIDMQDCYLGEEDVDHQEISKMIQRHIEILKYAQSNNLPIYVLEYGSTYKDPEYCRVCESFGQTTKLLQKVLNEGDYTLIIKNRHSGFDITGLDSFLKNDEISELVLMGVYASVCVLATGQDAVQKNYKIITSPEIIEDNKHWKENESIDWYNKNGLVFNDYLDLINYLKKTKEN